MEKINFPGKFRAYLPMMALFLVLVFLMPRNPKFSYDYEKGSPWTHETLIAQFDFPVLKTDAQLLEEREKVGSYVIPYYRFDPRISYQNRKGFSELDFGAFSEAKAPVADALASMYSKGIISLQSGQENGGLGQDADALIYVQRDRRAVKMPLSEVVNVNDAKAFIIAAIAHALPDCNADSLFNAAGIASFIAPNLIFDQQTTDLVQEENYSFISTTSGVIRAGQTIVSEGEIVTAEIEQLLNSYEAEFNMNVGYDGARPMLWLGNILIAFSIVLVLFLAICYCNFRIFDEFNKYLYLLMIFTLAAMASSWIAETNISLFYVMPFTLISLYLLAFFPKRVVFSVYFISLLPMMIFAPNGVELFIMYLVAGTVAMLVFGYFNRGWLQFVTAFIVFIVMTIIWGSFRLIDGLERVDYTTIFDLALGSLLSVAGYPLIYLFERAFKLVSNSKLAELSDTNNSLLRELADKAPGTFQHALQVMNLSDAAARSIGANVLLVRAGALYHDIGKIQNPQCFTENENPGLSYHAGLTPKESAHDIIRHVSDGLAMAEKYGLPDVIREFISSHHGTSSTGYFLTQYLNAGGDPNEVSEFHYNGIKPVTKEHVVLMVCDAVEAASRSLKDYSPESISTLVDRIVDGKANEGQFSDADISLRELTVMKEEIKTYLQQMYHSRVSYPKRKEKATEK